MKALLLNSGIGSRMGSLTAKKPKCMCSIGKGYTIISWQLELLRRYGIKDVVITTGPHSNILEEYLQSLAYGMNISFVKNHNYEETNYIYSMYLVKEFLEDDVMLLHGDLVLESSVIEELVSAEDSVVTVDKLLELPEKDFKAKIAEERVKAIGIEYFGDDCVACQPAYKWLKKDFAIWMDEIEAMCKKGETKVYAENAFNNISDRVNLVFLELGNRLCNEIDNPEDLDTVSERFLKICY